MKDLKELNDMIEAYERGEGDLMLLVYNAYKLGLDEIEEKPSPGGIQLTETFIQDCKRIDPTLKKIQILMTGDFNRDITRRF